AGAGGHGRDQRADPGADGVPLLRRLETLAVRPAAYARPRWRALLHPHAHGYRTLARGCGRRGVRDADDAVGTWLLFRRERSLNAGCTPSRLHSPAMYRWNRASPGDAIPTGTA